MATVNRSYNLEACPANEISMKVSDGKLYLSIYLKDGDRVLDQKLHIIPVSGAVLDQDGQEMYANAPGSISEDLQTLLDSVNAYIEQAATDNKL